MQLSDPQLATSKLSKPAKIVFVAPDALVDDYAIVGDGQYVVDLLEFLKHAALKLPMAIYVRNENPLLPASMLRDEQLLHQYHHRQLVLGTNSFHLEILKRIGSMIHPSTEICDVLMDTGQTITESTPWFWRSKPPSDCYLLIVTLYPRVSVEGYLKSFLHTLRLKGIQVFVRHPLQKISTEIISNALAIILWNGSGDIYQGFISQCNRLNRKITYAECGFFPQSQYWYFDRDGVNSNSQLKNDSCDWLAEDDNKRLLETRKRFFADIEPYSGAVDYIFVPLQVPDDSNVVQHSRFNQGMQGFIDFVLQEYAGETLIFKAHPKDKKSSNYRIGHAHWSNVDSRRLIRGAKKVVGINSSVLY